MIFFCRYWCGPRLGVDMPLEKPGRTGFDSETGDFKLTVLPGSETLFDIGSGSRNRTVGGADLRLRFASTELEGLRAGFMEERLGAPADASLLTDDALGWLSEDRLERRVDVGVVLLLESGGLDPVVIALRCIMESSEG